jgi:superfamily I DNA and/or RNA helicase
MKILARRFVVDDSVPQREGGMADVVCAFDSQRSMERVAVKLFRDGMVGPGYVLEAFSRECQSLVELNSHPNIIRLIDFGTDAESDRKYIALAWAQDNLVDFVKAHPLAGWDDFYERFGRPTLNALAFAYSRNIIHRDVKPHNVLLDDERNVKVADFGISKLRKYYRPGITMAHFRSVPYAPELDTEEFADSRDVYSYAVLALECLSPEPFVDYAAVNCFLENEVDLPEAIYAILGKALSKQPEDRFANVTDLLHVLEAAQRQRRRVDVRRRPCPMHVSAAALETWMVEIGERSDQKARDRLIDDLNEQCGVDRWLHDGEDTRFFMLVTAEFRYQVAIDDDHEDKLVVVKVLRGQPSRLERVRERAWDPKFDFRLAGKGEDRQGREAIEWLQNGLDEFLAERRKAEAQRREGELFDRWASLLRLKSEVEQLRETPIAYKSVEAKGQRLLLEVVQGTILVSDFVGQPRMIRSDDGRTFTGIVENVEKRTLTLYCDTHYAQEAVPGQGKLVYDTRRANVSIKRQFAALDAVRYDRASRADLRRLLVGVQELRVPTQIDRLDFFQSDLDDDKKKAVAVALGTHDFLVVEGPPGTGKTKFITELILQFARRNPGARVLLSSQTHNALDNALQRVRLLAQRAKISLRLARIGRRGDDKISLDVADLILEKGVESWLNSAERNSERFLEDWAEKNGITIDLVRTGMALANFRLASARLREAKSDANRLQDLRDQLEEVVAGLRDKPQQGDEFRVAEERLEVCLRDLSISEGELAEREVARRKAFDSASKFPDLRNDLEDLDEADMESLEHAYLEHAEGGEKCRELITIIEEWRDRFGRSSDFNGAYLSGCDVVAGTCIGVAGISLQSVEFDLCIVDEASKATPTEMLVPLAKSKRWIVVGDSKQLPPYVGDVAENPKLLDQFGLDQDAVRETLLDHLISELPEFARTSLLTQHRMVRPIGDLVSHCFYNKLLRNVNDDVDPWLAKSLVMPRPVTWFTTAKMNDRREDEKRQGGRREFRNFAELKLIENILRRLQFAASQRGAGYEVILLSGYGAQVGELDNLALRLARNIPDIKMTSGTVDSFQGREADIAIYSVTRSNETGEIGFLKERERLNVALSRAKVGLAIVGDSHFCDNVRGKNPFVDVLSYIRTHPDDCRIEEALA